MQLMVSIEIALALRFILPKATTATATLCVERALETAPNNPPGQSRLVWWEERMLERREMVRK